jgi:putative addiction module antidote
VIEVKIRKIGNSLGVVLPKEALETLKAGEGDKLVLQPGPDGYVLKVSDPEVERLMGLARGIMAKRRKVLRALAK